MNGGTTPGARITGGTGTAGTAIAGIGIIITAGTPRAPDVDASDDANAAPEEDEDAARLPDANAALSIRHSALLSERHVCRLLSLSSMRPRCSSASV